MRYFESVAVNKTIRMILYAVLIISALLFGGAAFRNYSAFMKYTGDLDEPISDAQVAKKIPTGTGNAKFSRIILFGGGFFISVLGLGLLVGHDFSHYISERFGRLLFNDEGETIKKSDYEIAEEIWADGNPLEAVQKMREHLQKNPREIHVAIRIAEIYEKDLKNPLAAALEYEEVLKNKLADEQWGWSAIHLCNIYISKLQQKDKAIALLRRICEEYGETAAAEKARKRLEMYGESTELEAIEENSETEDETPQRAPAKKIPLKNEGFQAQLEKFHRKTIQPKKESGEENPENT